MARNETFFIKGQRPIRETLYDTRHGALLNPAQNASLALALQTPLDISFAFLYAEEWNDSTRSSAR
mgnify:CR=1 FL=1